MANSKSKPAANHVKKDTMLLVAAVCLLVGFLGGVVFSVFKLNTQPATTATTTATSDTCPRLRKKAAQPSQLSPEQIQQLTVLEKDTAAHPDDAKAWIQLGEFYFDTNQPHNSIQAYTKALKLDPNNAQALTDLGVMYRRAGEFDNALKSFDRAIKLDATLTQPRYNKGVVLLYDLHRQKEAFQVWEGLLKIDPNAKAPDGQPLGELIKSYREKSKPKA